MPAEMPPYTCSFEDPMMDSVDLLDANNVLQNRVAMLSACTADWVCKASEVVNLYPDATYPLHWVETVWPSLLSPEEQ